MHNRSRTTLFLIELLIAIVIFAVCAAVCLRIFAGARVMSANARDLSHALIKAQSAAECFKAFKGSVVLTAAELSDNFISENPDSALIFYDENWQTAPSSNAAFTLRLSIADSPDEPDILTICDIDIVNADGEKILTIRTAARKE